MSTAEFNLYRYSQYKQLLKDRLTYVRRTKAHLSWRFIAQKLPMQSTYLSKALGEGKTQLSEDDVFRICQWLELKNDEIEFVLLLRAENVTTEKERREFLIKKLEDIRKKRFFSADHMEAKAQQAGHEMNYFLDPMAVLVHGALFLTRFKSNPILLCSHLGINQTRLKKILQILNQCEFIALGEDPFSVKDVFAKSPHFGREHPFTRVHQTAMKSVMMARLNQTAEENKESFTATFTMEARSFPQVKEAFHEFIRKAQALAPSSKNDKTHKLYQMNFDFIEWF